VNTARQISRNTYENGTASPKHAVPPTPDSLDLLTLTETARELRCSRRQLHRILCGSVAALPPMPIFHIGRRSYIRRSMLEAWIKKLESREREDRYVTGFFGIRDDEFEFIAGA